jgi:hypothetical protein
MSGTVVLLQVLKVPVCLVLGLLAISAYGIVTGMDTKRADHGRVFGRMFFFVALPACLVGAYGIFGRPEDFASFYIGSFALCSICGAVIWFFPESWRGRVGGDAS